MHLTTYAVERIVRPMTEVVVLDEFTDWYGELSED
jgi:hypothetical protein